MVKKQRAATLPSLTAKRPAIIAIYIAVAKQLEHIRLQISKGVVLIRENEMHDRRAVLGGISLFSLTPAILYAQAAGSGANVEQDEIEAWIKDPENAGYFDPPKVSDVNRGSLILAPKHPDVVKAANYLIALPAMGVPIELAKYMMRTIPAGMNMEWPPDTPGHQRPANPLIVSFFAATKTKPYAGDETAWCAAFACWVLRRCGLPYPNSAGSASFRDFPALPATTNPKVGDLVVFKHRNRPANGHVTFFDGFVDSAKTKVWCVGGNQGNRLSRVAFRTTGEMFVHSYRSVPAT